jgi:lysophospholipase L1-like esterase
VASAFATVLLAALADRIIVGPIAPPELLIFPPHAEYRYRTSEFSAVARTNARGFRDREFTPRAERGTTRILAIGDSFTYGWGVENDEAWPKVLERRLLASGVRVEIANLGRPGGDPASYAAVAQKAIPILRPAVTIVAVLLGDDLAALSDQPDEVPSPSVWGRLARALLPNLMNLRAHWLAGQAEAEPEPPWSAQAADQVGTYTPQERERLASLDIDVRRAFASGDLNASWVDLSVREPHRLLDVYDPDRPAVQKTVARLSGHLAAIRRVASAYQSDVIVLSVPLGPYASARDYRNAQRVGFALVPEMLTSARGDEPIRRASEQAGVAFVSCVGEFRREAAARALFFELDGHFNRAGHDVFATLVEPAVAARVSTLRHAAR